MVSHPAEALTAAASALRNLPPRGYASIALVLFLGLIGLIAAWAPTASPAAPAGPAEAARECQRANDVPFEGDWDAQDAARVAWVAVCRQALVGASGDAHLKHLLARALTANGQREEAIVLWRELAEANDAEAASEIYSLYNSYYRNDVSAPQLVKRDEAEKALRKAAGLGDRYSILMLAVLLDRGGTVKRDPVEAIHWAELAVAHPAKDEEPVDMQVLLGRLLVKSPDAAERARGLALLADVAQRGRGDAQAELARAIRKDDPERARALLEKALHTFPGHAVPLLADMLIKGEGGPADPKRAVALLNSYLVADVPEPKGVLGQLYLDGVLAPKDAQKGIDLMSIWAAWDYDARLRLMAALAANPAATVYRPAATLYDATEAAGLGEPGALDALIDLKLSQSVQFRDQPGGCALVKQAAARGDDAPAKRWPQCGTAP